MLASSLGRLLLTRPEVRSPSRKDLQSNGGRDQTSSGRSLKVGGYSGMSSEFTSAASTSQACSKGMNSS